MARVIVYQAYTADAQPGVGYVVLPDEKPLIALTSRTAQNLLRLSKIFAVIGILILVLNYAPMALAWAGNGFSLAFKSNINLTNSEAVNMTQSTTNSRSGYQPPFDPRLSKENRLIIPTIGVTTDIQEATFDNYESALKTGVWRVSDFGAPDANNMPTILVAHRYGYLAWTNLFRRQNSFYNLPKLNVGDTVEIDWKQRRYVYEIYNAGNGTQITDYSADLILYTCVDLNGPDRIFKYAKLISI